MKHVRFLSVVILLSFLAACTRTVEMPRTDIAAEAGREARRGWQIDTRSGERYLAKRYSLTDSTLVIEELAGADVFYGEHKGPGTIVIPLSDLAAVSRVKISAGSVVLIGMSLLVVGVLAISIGNGGFSADDR